LKYVGDVAPTGNGKPNAYKPPLHISSFASWVGSLFISIWIRENVSLSGLNGTHADPSEKTAEVRFR
jgi:hypothetical protein